MEKLKIRIISSTSPSFFLNTGKGDINRILGDDWFAQVAKQIKKVYPKLDVECWDIEKSYRKEKVEFFDNIKFRIFPSNFSIRPGMEISLPMIKACIEEQRKLKDNEKLIIHLQEYHSWQAYLLLLFLKKKKNIKIIAQHHGGRSPFKNLKKYKRLVLFLPVIALMQFFENLLFKKVNIFYAFGDRETSYLKKLMLSSKIKFQTMGISDEYFKVINKEKAKGKLKLDKNKRYVLYIGRIKTTKGIKELLDAVNEFKNQNIELLLIGEGPDFEKYKTYVEKKKITNAKFLGAIYGKEKLDYLSACDCFILPSYTEGAPVVLMEAIAKNLPVIASDVGGVRKMIKNGREGLIINPKSSEEITKAIKEILTWERKSIKRYAEKYKWEKIIKETVKDYKK